MSSVPPAPQHFAWVHTKTQPVHECGGLRIVTPLHRSNSSTSDSMSRTRKSSPRSAVSHRMSPSRYTCRWDGRRNTVVARARHTHARSHTSIITTAGNLAMKAASTQPPSMRGQRGRYSRSHLLYGRRAPETAFPKPYSIHSTCHHATPSQTQRMIKEKSARPTRAVSGTCTWPEQCTRTTITHTHIQPQPQPRQHMHSAPV